MAPLLPGDPAFGAAGILVNGPARAFPKCYQLHAQVFNCDRALPRYFKAFCRVLRPQAALNSAASRKSNRRPDLLEVFT
jgi:hypothetical protein